MTYIFNARVVKVYFKILYRSHVFPACPFTFLILLSRCPCLIPLLLMFISASIYLHMLCCLSMCKDGEAWLFGGTPKKTWPQVGMWTMPHLNARHVNSLKAHSYALGESVLYYDTDSVIYIRMYQIRQSFEQVTWITKWKGSALTPISRSLFLVAPKITDFQYSCLHRESVGYNQCKETNIMLNKKT